MTNIKSRDLKSKGIEVEKIYCPSNSVIMIGYVKGYRPKIDMFGGN